MWEPREAQDRRHAGDQPGAGPTSDWYERELRFIAGVGGSRPPRPGLRHVAIGLGLILAVLCLAIVMS